MSLVLSYRETEDILIVEVTGEYSLDDAKSTFLEFVEYLKDHLASRVLVDCRNIVRPIPTNTMDDFSYGSFVAEQSLLNVKALGLPRLAYLVPEERFEFSTFPETVAMNRGANARVFKSEEEAITWLQS